VDDERVTEGAAPRDGICVECGVPIPHERLAELADAFRCGECLRSYEAEAGRGVADLKKTA
jgi:RNA polymerase-binding transcription factor DksA